MSGCHCCNQGLQARPLLETCKGRAAHELTITQRLGKRDEKNFQCTRPTHRHSSYLAPVPSAEPSRVKRACRQYMLCAGSVLWVGAPPQQGKAAASIPLPAFQPCPLHCMLPSGDCSGEKRLGKRAQHRATSLSAQAFFTEGLLSTFMMPCGGWSAVTFKNRRLLG